MSTDVKPKGKVRKACKGPPHFTPEFQRWARGHVSSESCAKNGARGFSATLAKHGPGVAFGGARKWRLSHPSSNELVMIGILSRLGIRYEREYRVGDTSTRLTFISPIPIWLSRSIAVFTSNSTLGSAGSGRRASESCWRISTFPACPYGIRSLHEMSMR